MVDIIDEATKRFLSTSFPPPTTPAPFRGVIILCVTQCNHGGVAAVYETGQVGENSCKTTQI